ncbi:unnamed protein product [Lactuca saligna]|uniref:Gnk2-homologous domain-containing protein n=1 Tax=Lactuca saligna TaxID=75948 RepID=A0AA35ZQD4_LACSI|nr:unnamed protein product [Lactuca saligna]
MLEQTLFLSFSIFYLLFSVLSISAANSIIYVECSQLYFTMATSYESHINSLFTSLSESSSISNFNKFQICPPGYSQSDVVYGLYQCRGDVSSTTCRDCVANSLSQLKTSCPMSVGGQIQSEGCFVKYNNTSFFGVEDKMEMSKSCGPSVVYNMQALNRIDDALAYLTAGNGQYFRKGAFENVQGVAQCVQDLTVSECEDCLLEARARLRSECETSSWGNMYLGKCFIRYTDQDNNNDANNDTYDYNDYDDDDSKKKKKKKRKTNLKQVRRLTITVGATVGGITSTATLGITVAVLYKKYRRDRSDESPPQTSTSPIITPPPPPPTPPPTSPQLTPPPSPPRGHYCNVVGGCTCPIPPPFNEAFFGARNEAYGIPWLSYRW